MMVVLLSMNQVWAQPATAPDVKDGTACGVLADHANHGTLAALALPFDQIIPEELGEKQPNLNLNAPAAKVDLNGDGHPFYAFIQRYSDKDQPDLIYLDTKGNRLDVLRAPGFGRNVKMDSVADFSLIRIAGKLYTLASNDDGPLYLSQLGKDHVETLVCKVSRDQPKVSIVQSKDEHLCQAALDGTLDYPKFELPYSTTSRNFHGKLPEVFPEPGAAAIDIDNDGKSDFVARITKKVKPLLAQGCSWSELAVLNNERTDLDKHRTSLLPHGGCQSERLPFRFGDQTYVQSKDVPDSNLKYDAITRLKDGKSETICRIDYVPVFKVEATSHLHSDEQARQ